MVSNKSKLVEDRDFMVHLKAGFLPVTTTLLEVRLDFSRKSINRIEMKKVRLHSKSWILWMMK
jgi:hypothetical protein